MIKELFLEYKFGDYDLDLITNSGATGVIAGVESLNDKRINELRNLPFDLSLFFSVFLRGCPLEPGVLARMERLVKECISFNPKVIWLDRFRFPGHWEAVRNNKIPDLHEPCELCSGKNRVEEMEKIAKKIRDLVPENIKLGYFAVPFKAEEIEDLHNSLGQNHQRLGKYFNLISPMLYQRMINKPVEYISEYVKYLTDLTNREVWPIIQVKDMPDNLVDGIDKNILQKEYGEAVKPPAKGVVWFSWDGVVEKNKTGIIAQLNKS